MSYKDRQLIDYLPQYYREVREAVAIQDAAQAQLREINADVADLLDQLFVDTATWGLAHWERVTALEDNASLPTAERRSAIKAKLRGAGTVTLAFVQSLVDSWHGAETQVSEEGNVIAIKFAPRDGMSSDLRGLRRSLRDSLPAHLGWEITVTLKAENIVIGERAYDFAVNYPITNTFTTAAVDGRLIRGGVDFGARSYDFGVQYPICGDFYPEGQTITARNGLGMTAGATVVSRVKYARAGEQSTGEATL